MSFPFAPNDGVPPPPPPLPQEQVPPPPPPPRPPPPPVEVDDGTRQLLKKARITMEAGRCMEAELEACLLFGSSLLQHPHGIEDTQGLPGGVVDAWAVLQESTAAPDDETKAGSSDTVGATTTSAATVFGIIPPEDHHGKDQSGFKIGGGQLGKAAHTAALATTLKRAHEVAKSIQSHREAEAALFKTAMKESANAPALLSIMDEALQDIRSYHARHYDDTMMAPRPWKRQRGVPLGNPTADGYDLASMLAQSIHDNDKSALDVTFSTEEVMGKYLDLQKSHELFYQSMDHSKTFVDYVSLLSNRLEDMEEDRKLKERKKYLRFLGHLQDYLTDFLNRTLPLLDIAQITEPALADFEAEWGQYGGTKNWKHVAAEAAFAATNSNNSNDLDLGQYASVEELEQAVDGDTLKAELSRLGLKCGGTVKDRAKRLWLTKDTPLDELPKKLFVATRREGRVDIARKETIVVALLDQLRPTLEATLRRAERRQTQTLNEREQEVKEELHGSSLEKNDKDENNSSDDEDDEEDAPIYNPKGVPLGWDGKPIPYWLFKLHGLNHFYPCEICGNEAYRGRRNFEKHFAESKHVHGMRCLGIPNTQHFHGITKIQDAQELWGKLQNDLVEGDHAVFDAAKQEEYEDSHGNVLSRATYEDLARQGLL